MPTELGKEGAAFEKTVTYAISLGGDTDTIGAMAGAISGAYLGIEAIPAEWQIKLVLSCAGIMTIAQSYIGL
jgi:ADP-ribosylglycohydrolase